MSIHSVPYASLGLSVPEINNYLFSGLGVQLANLFGAQLLELSDLAVVPALLIRKVSKARS